MAAGAAVVVVVVAGAVVAGVVVVPAGLLETSVAADVVAPVSPDAALYPNLAFVSLAKLKFKW